MTPGRRFAEALAAKDATALRGLLAADLDFRALTPRREWVAASPDDFLEVAFANWFEDDDRIDALLGTHEGEPVQDTAHVSYRLALTSGGTPYTCEQQAYYRTEGDRIVWLRVLCSGFRPDPAWKG